MGCGTSSATKVKKATPQVLSVNAGTFLTANKGGLPAHFKPIKNLGSGAFADVKLCRVGQTDQRRAVKYIHKAGLHAQHMDSQLFLKEVKVLKDLDHPNILKCYEIYEDLSKFYVVMEFCEGGELFERIIAMKKFSESNAAKIMHQLLSAVAYCHGKSVIHRDLKPENILLDEQGSSLDIKVADFGNCAVIDTGKRLSGCFGSAYYLAPEVMLGEYNEKCDVWSCGVIMFILLTGKPPYPGNDEKQILEMIKHNPLQIGQENVRGISENAVDLLRNLLCVDIRQRSSAQDAVNHPWIKDYLQSQEHGNLLGTLENLKAFRSSVQLKEAVHVYLATQIVSKQDLKQLRENFQALDTNSDGKISRSELLAGYNKSMGMEEAEEEVTRIMRQVDSDLSGEIDYGEFVKACMNHNKYLSRDNLRAAFSVFDKDGSGFITTEELKMTLGDGELYDEDMWQKLIKEVDANGDGVIDLKEFVNLMMNY